MLIHLCSTAPPGTTFVGVEIDPGRADEARANIAAAGLSDRITVLTENAMLVDYSKATHMFLYLVPRGLRIFKPVLLACREGGGAPPLLEVVTYMAGFLDEKAVKKVTVEVEHQEGAKWPLFLFHFGKQPDVGVDVSAQKRLRVVASMAVGVAAVAVAWTLLSRRRK